MYLWNPSTPWNEDTALYVYSGTPLFQLPEMRTPLYTVELFQLPEMRTPLYTVEFLYFNPLKWGHLCIQWNSSISTPWNEDTSTMYCILNMYKTCLSLPNSPVLQAYFPKYMGTVRNCSWNRHAQWEVDNPVPARTNRERLIFITGSEITKDSLWVWGDKYSLSLSLIQWWSQH